MSGEVGPAHPPQSAKGSQHCLYGLAATDYAFGDNITMTIQNYGDPEVVFVFQIRIGGDVDNVHTAPQPTGDSLDLGEGLLTEPTSRTSQEYKCAMQNLVSLLCLGGGYGDSPMRPATAAVIIGLLVLILGSSLIWVLRSF